MEKLQIRPHHLFCGRFLNVELPDRGEAFEKAERDVKAVFEKEDVRHIEVMEGIDGICRTCPDMRDGRCASAFGNEDAVRKWDNHVLKGLGINYGDEKTVREWRNLIEEKAPIPFCENKCPWKTICTVFDPK